MNHEQKEPPPGELLYDPAYYDRGYYGEGARGGFPSYEYNSDEQRIQLALKRDLCAKVPHDSILFIGCARGFEVADAFANGKIASGLDVSTWAIANQIPEARGQCSLYDGALIPLPDDSVDVVACFDVLPHLPIPMRETLCAEFVRVARKGIVWRQIVKNWRNLHRMIDGLDGAWVRCERFENWDQRFTCSGKFELFEAKLHHQYEVAAVYKRRAQA
jgi:hypothetical protein